ncbi:MAG: response regulator, partial [Planctomycetota bacterium]
QRTQLEEASRLKSEFLSNMSHELRTPLNSVLALSQLMITRGPGKNAATDIEHLRIIERNGRQLLNLINDILDISKIEAGRMDLTLMEFSPESVIQEVAATVKPLSEEKNLEFTVSADSLPDMKSDRGKLKQILLNLLSNAVKFTEEGKVSLCVFADENDITFNVSDTGIGIPENSLNQVFEEFRQADGSNTRRYDGTGLGLSISQRLARLLGGEISVESKVNSGSTFTLVLPLADFAEKESEADLIKEFPTAEMSAGRHTVLVIDDEEDASQLICNQLDKLGYDYVEARSGKEALELAEKVKPFAITLDILMPEMDGWEVLQTLKSNEKTSRIPVIVVSVSDDRETGRALGAAGYVVKPVDSEVLKAELERIKSIRRVRKVLVVDDDLVVREQLKYLLGEEKYQVFAVDNGQTALESIKSDPPDAVVLDLLMPVMDGFSVLESMRSDPATYSIPVIVLTSKDITAQENAVLAGAARRVISKAGGNGDQLRHELHEALLKLENVGFKSETEQPHILVVEDNEIATLQIKSILEENNYIVTTAENGEKGLAAVRQELPDGIILDLMMPEMDGFEVLEQIRSTQWSAKLPVLILTAKELTQEDRSRLSNNNVYQLIQKGNVDKKQLLKEVSCLVEKSYPVCPDNSAVQEVNIPVKNTALPQSEDKPILIVEDNPDNRVTIEAIISDIGRECVTVDNGDDGILQAQKIKPGLILMDIQLPGMSGVDVMKILKKDQKLKNIPVIALTARAMKGDREEFLKEGFDDYMSKPIDPELLQRLIEEWTEI